MSSLNTGDATRYARHWEPRYDLDDDGDIDIVDIMRVAAHWGERCDDIDATW